MVKCSYRRLTKKNRYPQMNIERIMSRICQEKYFVSIDKIALQDRMKTAFVIYGMGIFQYKRMPMGLVNLAVMLCELVEKTFNMQTEPGLAKIEILYEEIEVFGPCIQRKSLKSKHRRQ